MTSDIEDDIIFRSHVRKYGLEAALRYRLARLQRKAEENRKFTPPLPTLEQMRHYRPDNAYKTGWAKSLPRYPKRMRDDEGNRFPAPASPFIYSGGNGRPDEPPVAQGAALKNKSALQPISR